MIMNQLQIGLVYLCLSLSSGGTNADSILFLYPIATKSETHLFLPIAESLARRGHSLTIISPVPVTTKVGSNISVIVPTTPLKDVDFLPPGVDIMEERRAAQNPFASITSYDMTPIIKKCHEVYQNEDFQKVLANGKFDGIFMSGTFSECLEGISYVFKAPYILMTSMPPFVLILEKTGFRPPPSLIPLTLIDMPRDMNFKERFINTILTWSMTLLNPLNSEGLESIYKIYLGEDVPGVAKLQENLSLLFTNTHFSLTFPRPVMPDTIEIGGLHCGPPKPLPKELEEFMQSAKHGVIFFSLGSVVQTSTLPDSMKKMFLNTFAKLKQKVLWKWDGEMENLPPNVKISKWLPQQDILGHPKVKLFISHAGLLSMQESGYHGVPMLCLPYFADQDINAREAERLGFGLREEILEITEESFHSKIQKLLTDPTLTEEAKKISRIVKDQPQTPIERATFWFEYVLRHKGAKHLKSAAKNLNFFQYHSFDVIGVLLGGITVFITLVSWVLYKLCTKLKRAFTKKKSSKEKRN